MNFAMLLRGSFPRDRSFAFEIGANPIVPIRCAAATCLGHGQSRHLNNKLRITYGNFFQVETNSPAKVEFRVSMLVSPETSAKKPVVQNPNPATSWSKAFTG